MNADGGRRGEQSVAGDVEPELEKSRAEGPASTSRAEWI